MRYRFAAVCVLVVMLSACDEQRQASIAEDDGPDPIPQLDLAGNGLWMENDRWVVDPEPELTINSVEGAIFFHVVGVASTVDNEVAVLNGTPPELNLFDAHGEWVRTLGSEGEGPGDLKFPQGISSISGDTLVVADLLGTRLSFFSKTGGRVPTVRLVAPIGEDSPFLTPLGRSANAFWGAQYWSPDSSWSGLTRNVLRVSRRYLGETRAEHVGVFPGRTLFRGASPYSIARIPFAGDALTRTGHTGLYIADTQFFSITLINPEGETTSVYELETVRVPIGQERKAAYIDSVRHVLREARASPLVRYQLDNLENLPFPEFFPSLADFRVDPYGNVWARPYSSPRRWAVFSETGDYLGSVTMPEGVAVMEITADFVLGVLVDGDGVESIVRHRLRKP